MHLVEDVLLALKRSLRTLVDNIITGVETYAVSAKRCGILPIVANLPAWIRRSEQLLAGAHNEHCHDILGRGSFDTLDGWGPEEGIYSKLIHAVDAKLETIAYSNENYTFIILMENYGRIAKALGPYSAAPELSQTSEMAAQCSAANLASYVDKLIERHFGELVHFFTSISQSNIESTEIQYQSNFSKPVFLEVLRSFGPSSNVPKLVSEMRRKMVRQLSSGVGPAADAEPCEYELPVLWIKLAETLSERWGKWDLMCEQCYGDIHLPITATELRAILDAK